MHEGHRERIREKYLENGLNIFSPHEIIEMMLFFSKPRENTNPLAHELIEAFGSFTGVLDADARDLMKINGVGKQTAVLIKLFKDVSEYYQKERWRGAKRLHNVEEIGYYILDMIGDKPYESLYVLCLDNANKIISFSEVERGSVSSSAINMRKVVETAVRNNAEKIVLAHNHPSGIIIPSQEDIDITDQFGKAFKALNIKMLDHIIVGGKGFTSLAKENHI